MATNIREKAAKRQANKDKRPFAKAKYVRITPFKVRAVLDLIRGKDLREAEAILTAVNKSSCEPVLKVLKSAAANAENNLGMNRDDLYVAECFADAGTIMKRFMPKSHGRATSLFKRTSHITVILDARNQEV